MRWTRSSEVSKRLRLSILRFLRFVKKSDKTRTARLYATLRASRRLVFKSWEAPTAWVVTIPAESCFFWQLLYWLKNRHSCKCAKLTTFFSKPAPFTKRGEGDGRFWLSHALFSFSLLENSVLYFLLEKKRIFYSRDCFGEISREWTLDKKFDNSISDNGTERYILSSVPEFTTRALECAFVRKTTDSCHRQKYIIHTLRHPYRVATSGLVEDNLRVFCFNNNFRKFSDNNICTQFFFERSLKYICKFCLFLFLFFEDVFWSVPVVFTVFHKNFCRLGNIDQSTQHNFGAYLVKKTVVVESSDPWKYSVVCNLCKPCALFSKMFFGRNPDQIFLFAFVAGPNTIFNLVISKNSSFRTQISHICCDDLAHRNISSRKKPHACIRDSRPTNVACLFFNHFWLVRIYDYRWSSFCLNWPCSGLLFESGPANQSF